MKDKKLVEDKHYTFDEITRKITFITDEPMYEIEKNVFATGGVDIDKIVSIEEYDKYKFKFCNQTMNVIQEIWRNKQPGSLRGKYTKCIVLNDFKGMEKYRKIFRRIKSLNLTTINKTESGE